MNIQKITLGVVAIASLAGVMMFSSTVHGESYEKTSNTQFRVTSNVEVVTEYSLPDLMKDRDEVQSAIDAEQDKHEARMNELNSRKSDLNELIDKAVEIGVTVSAVETPETLSADN